MEYYVTKFSIATENDEKKQICRDLLTDMVADAGYESFEEIEDGVNAYVQQTLWNKPLLEQILEDFPIKDVKITHETKEVVGQDWNKTWEDDGFEPITVGNHGDKKMCIIYDAKSSAEMAAGAAGGAAQGSENTAKTITIAIDAKMAFGTGTHETTRMIVGYLLKMEMEGKSVLDCGCGTGILSLVAKTLGAEHVTAYDIDEWSVENTKHNAEINGIPLIDVLLGDVSVLSHVDGVFDVIMANINRNILLGDMPSIVETLALDGQIILSGFYEEDAKAILEKASTLGLYEAYRQTENNWCMLVLHK